MNNVNEMNYGALKIVIETNSILNFRYLHDSF